MNEVDPNALTQPPSDPDATVGGATEVVPIHALDKKFGEYELMDVIARGGMGVVCKAKHSRLSRIVALKTILSGRFANPAEAGRFKAEAAAAALLEHPNIVPVYEVGEQAGQHFFSMKLLDGGSLATLLKADPPTPQRDLVEMLATVAHAIHYAHQRGILHRDLKPSNILLDQQGVPYVTDFGLARRVERDQGLTQSGVVVGTPSYMAPEQARADKNITTACDVYGLGAMLYEIITGKPPFQGENVLDTVMQVVEKEPEQPTKINPKADRDLSTVALKCLEKDPEKRYGSAEQFAEELERWLRGESVLARPASTIERAYRWARRRPELAGLVGAVAVLVTTVLFGLAAMVIQKQRNEQKLEAAFAQASGERDAARKAEADAAAQRDAARRAEAEAASQRDLALKKEQEGRRYWYAADLAVAQQALQNNRINRTMMLLRQHIPKDGETDLRGFEWHYLWRQLHPETKASPPPKGGGFIEYGPRSGVAVVEPGYQRDPFVGISKDGATTKLVGEMFVGWADGPAGDELVSVDLVKSKSQTEAKLHCRDVKTGHERPGFPTTIPVEKGLHSIPLIDGHGKVLAAFHGEGTDSWYSATITKGHLAFPKPEGGWTKWAPITGVDRIPKRRGFNRLHPTYACLPDGRLVIAGGKTVDVFRSVRENRRINIGSGIQENVGSALVFVDPKSGRMDSQTLPRWNVMINALTVDPKRNLVIVGADDGQIRLFRPGEESAVSILRGHVGGVTALAINGDATRMASGGRDGTIRVWNMDTQELATVLPAHGSEVRCIHFADDNTLVSGEEDGIVKHWNLERPIGAVKAQFRRPGPGIEELLLFSSDGQALFLQTGTINADISGQWLDAATLQPKKGMPRPLKNFINVSKSPNGPVAIVPGIWSTPTMIFEMETGKRRFVPRSGTAAFDRGTVVSSDGQLLMGFADGNNTALQVSETATAKPVATFRDSDLSGFILGQFSPDSRTVITRNWRGEVKLWDARTGADRGVLANDVTGVNPVFIAGGTKVVLWRGRNSVQILDLETRRAETKITGAMQFKDMTVSPDGRRLFASMSGIQANEIKVYDLESGQELLTLAAGAPIAVMALSPTGHRLAALDETGMAYTWDASPVTDAKERIAAR